LYYSNKRTLKRLNYILNFIGVFLYKYLNTIMEMYFRQLEDYNFFLFKYCTEFFFTWQSCKNTYY